MDLQQTIAIRSDSNAGRKKIKSIDRCKSCTHKKKSEIHDPMQIIDNENDGTKQTNPSDECDDRKVTISSSPLTACGSSTFLILSVSFNAPSPGRLHAISFFFRENCNKSRKFFVIYLFF